MYLPSINLVWASNPGNAPKKKPTTGMRINSNGAISILHNFFSTGFGLCLNSKISIINRNTVVTDKTIEDNLGNIYPIEVRLKLGLTKVEMVTPMVIKNQYTGHKI